MAEAERAPDARGERGPSAPVLVVDDNPDTRETIRYILEHAGHTVAEASHGGEALALLEAGTRPCLILLDIMMPVMTGLEFLEVLRRDPAHFETPVVLISAWPHSASEVPSVQGFMQKPFRLAELLECTKRFCETARGPPPPP